LCGRVAVLRRGQVAGEAQAPFSTSGLVQMMFGQEIKVGARPSAALGGAALELEGVALRDSRMEVSGLTLKVQTGEVIGLAGLEGSGQNLFLRGCAGLLRPSQGVIHFNGRDCSRLSYRRWLAEGVAYMPADRMREGLVPGLTIAEHVVLARRGRQPAVIDWQQAQDDSDGHIDDFNIKGRPASRVEALSGGNQQRTQLALLPPNLRLLALEHPTRGLDVESALYIWAKLLERRKDGTAIIFASADLDEIMQYSDRILIFFGGQVIDERPAAKTNVEQLGYLIGSKKQ